MEKDKKTTFGLPNGRRLGPETTKVLQEAAKAAKAKGPQMLRWHNLAPDWGHPTSQWEQPTSDE